MDMPRAEPGLEQDESQKQDSVTTGYDHHILTLAELATKPTFQAQPERPIRESFNFEINAWTI